MGAAGLGHADVPAIAELGAEERRMRRTRPRLRIAKIDELLLAQLFDGAGEVVERVRHRPLDHAGVVRRLQQVEAPRAIHAHSS